MAADVFPNANTHTVSEIISAGSLEPTLSVSAPHMNCCCVLAECKVHPAEATALGAMEASVKDCRQRPPSLPLLSPCLLPSSALFADNKQLSIPQSQGQRDN